MAASSRWLKNLYRFLRLGAVLVGLTLCVVLAAAWEGLGARARGSERARIERSPNFRDGKFVNPEPLQNDWWGSLTGMLDTSPHASPGALVPTRAIDPTSLQTLPETGLRVTWLGHSTNLIEIDGLRVLTDPSWSERSSPVSWLGPKRWFAPPIALADLPRIDVVLISHDHFDHLDHRTIIAMRDWPTSFIVPLGVGAHLAYWGVPRARIVELDWWERVQVGGLELVCTPARHASGRSLLGLDETLWAGYALVGNRHRVFFSGDTGLFPALREVGQRLGPFDVTMIEIGQYHTAWPDWHIGPEQAVKAHGLLRGRALLPVHWGKLQLAYHGWTEPIERTLAAAARANVRVIAPMPGESVEPDLPRTVRRWWPTLPWQTHREMPIVSTGIEDLGT